MLLACRSVRLGLSFANSWIAFAIAARYCTNASGSFFRAWITLLIGTAAKSGTEWNRFLKQGIPGLIRRAVAKKIENPGFSPHSGWVGCAVRSRIDLGKLDVVC